MENAPALRLEGLVTQVLAVLGAALVLLDYVIKFIAIGVIPSNRKPSSAMAWLILILIIPLAGFAVFLFLGRTSVGAKRLARQRAATDAIRAATDELRSPRWPGRRTSARWRP